jgi:hypothetical protein
VEVRVAFFWMKTLARYALAACGAFVLSAFVAFLTVLPWAGEDSPGLGLLWEMIFCVEAVLIIPMSLALTAELVDRKVHSRRFQWKKVFIRFLLAIPMCIGPLYAFWWVSFYVENRRPTHWAFKETLFYCLSAIFVFFALRIKEPRGSTRNAQESVVR